MSGPLDKLSYIDPEQLSMLQGLMKDEREAAEKQLEETFGDMKYIPDRVQKKIVRFILASDSMRHVPPKEKTRIRSKILRLLKFIQAYEMQDGKDTTELEAKLDEEIQSVLITYKRDHRDNIIGGAGSVSFGGTDLGTGEQHQYTEQASLTDELQRGKYQKDIKNVTRQMDEVRRENEQLRLEVQNLRKVGSGNTITVKDNPDED